ncbi:MAG: helix-turn-helix domain-containing protein [Proteobacteria bacterium]|nr:helix-turn-helix domain-containing protein [Pseudomonadota bacterium]
MSCTKQHTNPFFITENNFFDIWGRHIKPMGFIVYSCLQRHANQGSCFPSHKRIAKMCGISRDSVIRNLKLLADFKLITIENRRTNAGGKTSNLYFINELPPAPDHHEEPTPVAPKDIPISTPATSHVAETDINNTKINEIKVDQTKFNKKTDDDQGNTHNPRSNPVANIVETPKPSASINLVETKPDVLKDIVYPKGFNKSQPVLQELGKLPTSTAVQQVIDVFMAKDNIRSPVGFLIALVKNFLANDFTPIQPPKPNPVKKVLQTCEMCKEYNGNLFFNKTEGTTLIKCNHNIPQIIAHAKKTQTSISGTKYNFRIDKPKPVSAEEVRQARKKLSDLIGGFNNRKNLPPR